MATPPLFLIPSSNPGGRSLGDPLFQPNPDRFRRVPVTNGRDFNFTSPPSFPASPSSDFYSIPARKYPASPLDVRPPEYSTPPKAIPVKPQPPPSQFAPRINVSDSFKTAPSVDILNRSYSVSSNINTIDKRISPDGPVKPTDFNGLYVNDVGFAQHFFKNLSTWAGGIPLQHFWVVQFDFNQTFLSRFQTWLNNADRSFDGIEWDDYELQKTVELLKANYQGQSLSNSPDNANLYTGCYFARNISIPGERVEVINPSIPSAGGMHFHNILNKRQAPTNVSISFMETNASFVDLFIRPWCILASQTGYIGREDNLKVNITATFFSKTESTNAKIDQTPGLPNRISTIQDYTGDLRAAPRKRFTFRGAMPLTVNTQEYTYTGESLIIRPVDFIYNGYKVDTYM